MELVLEVFQDRRPPFKYGVSMRYNKQSIILKENLKSRECAIKKLYQFWKSNIQLKPSIFVWNEVSILDRKL